MKVDDITKLMAAMSQHRVGVVEFEGVKLVLALESRQSPTAASSLALPLGPQVAPVTVEDAVREVQKARVQAAQNESDRLAAAQARTARSRSRAAGGIGANTPKLVADVFDAARKTKPPTIKSAPDTSSS